MKKIILFSFFTVFFGIVFSQEKHKLYLIPGHGSDIRVFSKINFPESVDTVHLHWMMPEKEETLEEYAFRFSQKIDTTGSYSIMGLSLGGMIACEMSNYLDPENIIIISSAAGRSELPLRYRMMKNFQIYRIFSPQFYKAMTKSAQVVYEPDRMKEAETFNAMIKDKNPVFIKRAIHMIVNWQGEYEQNGNIIHIHGTKDHTIPIRNVCSDLIVEKGSHMMVLTNPEPVHNLLLSLFGK